jgi:hypothetical protein
MFNWNGRLWLGIKKYQQYFLSILKEIIMAKNPDQNKPQQSQQEQQRKDMEKQQKQGQGTKSPMHTDPNRQGAKRDMPESTRGTPKPGSRTDR